MNLHSLSCFFFFFNDTATTEIYTLSLHDALPIWTSALSPCPCARSLRRSPPAGISARLRDDGASMASDTARTLSEGAAGVNRRRRPRNSAAEDDHEQHEDGVER